MMCRNKPKTWAQIMEAIMPRKDFVDERVSKKQRRLDKKRRKENEKALKKNKKEVQTALDNHRLGFKTRDGKEL